MRIVSVVTVDRTVMIRIIMPILMMPITLSRIMMVQRMMKSVVSVIVAGMNGIHIAAIITTMPAINTARNQLMARSMRLNALFKNTAATLILQCYPQTGRFGCRRPGR